MFSCEIFENFKNTYFEEHVRTTASARLRKISPFLALGKAMLEGKRHNWAANTFNWKYEPHEVSLCNITFYQNAFCYFFQASVEDKSDNDNDFKISWDTYCRRAILIVLNKQNEIFEIRNCSHPLNYFNFYLIYFYTQGVISSKIPPT